jgi:hypothetical protein
MTELERELRLLAAEVAAPPTPDFVPAVIARIERRRRRVRIGAALGLAALALGVALAVPPARSAVLRLFHLGGVTVERVDTLPAASDRALGRSLGRRLPLATAERAVGFRLLLPAGAAPPDARVRNGLASVVLARGDVPFVLSEFRAAGGYDLLKKVVADATQVTPVRVGTSPGLWVAGSPHLLFFVNRRGTFGSVPVLVRGNVLVWQRGGLTLRLQSALGLRDVLALARSVH